MRLLRGRTQANAGSSSGALVRFDTRSLSGTATGADCEPKGLLSARRPKADPLTLHLIEMHTRIVFGDR